MKTVKGAPGGALSLVNLQAVFFFVLLFFSIHAHLLTNGFSSARLLFDDFRNKSVGAWTKSK